MTQRAGANYECHRVRDTYRVYIVDVRSDAFKRHEYVIDSL